MSDAERQAMRERVQSMTPEQRAEFFAARRGQGGGPGGGGAPGGARRRANRNAGPAIPTVERGARTIDALFAPLEVAETAGRVWVMEGDRFESGGGAPGRDRRHRDGAARRGPDRGRRPDPPPTPQIVELRQQAELIDDPETRRNIEQMIQRLEAAPGTAAEAPMPAAALNEGAQLVTDVSTPEEGAGPAARSSSPLIPQFGRRGRR